LELGRRTLRRGELVSELEEKMKMKSLDGELLGREELSDSSRNGFAFKLKIRNSRFESFRTQISTDSDRQDRGLAEENHSTTFGTELFVVDGRYHLYHFCSHLQVLRSLS
jgi:hypothetical protein